MRTRCIFVMWRALRHLQRMHWLHCRRKHVHPTPRASPLRLSPRRCASVPRCESGSVGKGASQPSAACKRPGASGLAAPRPCTRKRGARTPASASPWQRTRRGDGAHGSIRLPRRSAPQHCACRQPPHTGSGAGSAQPALKASLYTSQHLAASANIAPALRPRLLLDATEQREQRHA